MFTSADVIETAEIISLLLQQNSLQVNLQTHYGNTPFQMACTDGKYQSVLLLIQDPRTDINMFNNWGINPLMCSVHHGRTQIVKRSRRIQT